MDVPPDREDVMATGQPDFTGNIDIGMTLGAAISSYAGENRQISVSDVAISSLRVSMGKPYAGPCISGVSARISKGGVFLGTAQVHLSVHDEVRCGLMKGMAREWSRSTLSDSGALRSAELAPGNSREIALWGPVHPHLMTGGTEGFREQAHTEKPDLGPHEAWALHLLAQRYGSVDHAYETDERALVGRCLAGEGQAWESFLSGYYRTIWSIVSWRKWGFDSAEKEDVTQDVLEALIRSLGNFEFKARVNTFVYRISISTCIAHLRKKTALKRGAASRHLPIDPISSECDDPEIHIHGNPCRNPEELLQRRESLIQIKQALARLEEKCRELVDSRYLKELSFREIADMTGVKENTLVVNLRRCLLRLFDLLQTAG